MSQSLVYCLTAVNNRRVNAAWTGTTESRDIEDTVGAEGEREGGDDSPVLQCLTALGRGVAGSTSPDTLGVSSGRGVGTRLGVGKYWPGANSTEIVLRRRQRNM